MSRERPELGCSVGCSDIEPLQGPFTALPMIIYNWAGDAKAEFKTALAPATIIVLMAITFLCNGVGAVTPESLRQAVMNAQLLLRADSR